MALFGCSAVPACGFFVVLGHTSAEYVRDAEAELRKGEAQFGCLSEPSGGLLMVLRHTPAAVVPEAEVGLCASVVVCGGASKPADCFTEIGSRSRHLLARDDIEVTIASAGSVSRTERLAPVRDAPRAVLGPQRQAMYAVPLASR